MQLYFCVLIPESIPLHCMQICAKRCRPPEECPNAYVAIMSNGSPHFRAYVPEGGCGRRIKTSVTATFHHCQYATNGGSLNLHILLCVRLTCVCVCRVCLFLCTFCDLVNHNSIIPSNADLY